MDLSTKLAGMERLKKHRLVINEEKFQLFKL